MTFEDVAERFEVRLCAGCQSRDHKTGEQVGNTIHWSSRRFTRAGLRNFLLLVASARLRFARPETWYRLYACNVWAASVARKELHITIPTKLTFADRAYVRWRIQTEPDAPAAVRTWANLKVAHDERPNKENTHGN